MALLAKDPVDIVDFSIDWSGVLESGELISVSSWTADAGLTIDSNSHTDTVSTVWVSGGSNGAGYRVYNTITTTAGRTYRRFIVVKVSEIRA